MLRVPPLSIRARCSSWSRNARRGQRDRDPGPSVRSSTSPVSQKLSTVEILASPSSTDVKYEVDPAGGHHQDVIAKYMTYYRNIRGISFYDPK